MKTSHGVVQPINYKKKSSILNPRLIQLSNRQFRINCINLFGKVTNVYVTTDDIEACHRIGKSKENL